MTEEQTNSIELLPGEYWVKSGKVDSDGHALYELWGTTRAFDGESFVELDTGE